MCCVYLYVLCMYVSVSVHCHSNMHVVKQKLIFPLCAVDRVLLCLYLYLYGIYNEASLLTSSLGVPISDLIGAEI
jgi:hypothetical protein